MPLHPFRFGIINEYMTPRAAWLDGVRRTEAQGFATFLLRDHLVQEPFGDQYAPFVALMAAAMISETLRVGTMVAANDFRHPAILAKEIATLHELSGGRVELGLGAGWLRAEYEAIGMPFAANGTRIARLAEAVQVLKGLWTGEPLDFAGEYYQVHGLQSTPRPATPPRLLLGGGHQKMLTLAGREADSIGILTSSVATGVLTQQVASCLPAAVQQQIGWIRAGAGARFNQIELSMIPTLIITDARRAATEAWLAARGWSGVPAEDVWQMPAVLIGSVAQLAEDLRARRDIFGISYYVFSDTQRDDAAALVRALV